jgi:hypothetical protein
MILRVLTVRDVVVPSRKNRPVPTLRSIDGQFAVLSRADPTPNPGRQGGDGGPSRRAWLPALARVVESVFPPDGAADAGLNNTRCFHG